MRKALPFAISAALFIGGCGGEKVAGETGCYMFEPLSGKSVKTSLAQAVTNTLAIKDPVSSPNTPGFNKTVRAINDKLSKSYEKRLKTEVPSTLLPQSGDVLGMQFTPLNTLELSEGGSFTIFEEGTLTQHETYKIPDSTARELGKHSLILVNCKTLETLAVPK